MLEIEELMFWNWKKGVPKFIHVGLYEQETDQITD